jgi:hypothetical protein
MKRFLALGVLVLCSCASELKGPDWDLVTRHVWIDHMPKSETEMIRSLVMLRHDVGATAEASQWRAVVDGFVWRKSDGGADVRFPQTGKTEAWSLRATKCDDAPVPFELCLVVFVDGQHRRFYSKREWIIPDDARGAGDYLRTLSAIHASTR